MVVTLHDLSPHAGRTPPKYPHPIMGDMPTSTLYGVFRAADGDLVIAAQVDDAWKRFAVMLEANGGPAGFGSDTRFHSLNGRNTHRVEILTAGKAWVAANPVARILSLLDEIDVPCAKVQRIDEVIADPQIKARNMVVEQQHPRYGTLRMPNLPTSLALMKDEKAMNSATPAKAAANQAPRP